MTDPIKVGDTILYLDYGCNYHKSGKVKAIDETDKHDLRLGIKYTLAKKGRQRYDKVVYEIFNSVKLKK